MAASVHVDASKREYSRDRNRASNVLPESKARLERRVKPQSDSWLIQFAKDNTSQGGEDGIIEQIFEHILPSPEQRSPLCVDVGAWDGKHLSNTFTLLAKKQWGGLLIEADPVRNGELQVLYEGRSDIHCIDAFVELSGANTLVKYLREFSYPNDFEFLSIDIDGADYYVWKSLKNQFSPKIVCIEFNPTIGNRVLYIQEPDSRVHQGSSLLAMVELGKDLGYKLLVTTTFNAFFVRDDLFHYFGGRIPILLCPEDLDRFNPMSMVTDLFQTYEGELKFAGPLKLMWHRMAMNPQKLQVLSKKQRYFPFSPLIDGTSTGKLLSSEITAVVTAWKKLLHSFQTEIECDCTRDFFMDTCADGGTDGLRSRASTDYYLNEFIQEQILAEVEIDSVDSRAVVFNVEPAYQIPRGEDNNGIQQHFAAKCVCAKCFDNIKAKWTTFLTACERIFIVSSMQQFCLDAIGVSLLRFAIDNQFCGPNIVDCPLFDESYIDDITNDVRFISKIAILKYLLCSASDFVKVRCDAIIESSTNDETLELLRIADATFWLSCQAMINENVVATKSNKFADELNHAIYASLQESSPSLEALSTPSASISSIAGRSRLRCVLDQECSPYKRSFQQLSYSSEEKKSFVEYCVQFGRLNRQRGSLLETWHWLTKASLYLTSLSSFSEAVVSDGDDRQNVDNDVDTDPVKDQSQLPNVSKEWKKLFALTEKVQNEINGMYNEENSSLDFDKKTNVTELVNKITNRRKATKKSTAVTDSSIYDIGQHKESLPSSVDAHVPVSHEIKSVQGRVAQLPAAALDSTLSPKLLDATSGPSNNGHVSIHSSAYILPIGFTSLGLVIGISLGYLLSGNKLRFS